MKCPDKDFVIEFRSMQGKDAGLRWIVRLVFPAGTDVNGKLPFYVTDWDDVPVPAGTFHFMGGRWPVEGGRGSVPCASFIAGIHDPAVWFRYPNGKPIPGGLTFA